MGIEDYWLAKIACVNFGCVGRSVGAVRVDAGLGASKWVGIIARTVGTLWMSIDFPSPACAAPAENDLTGRFLLAFPSRRSLEARRMKFSPQILDVLG